MQILFSALLIAGSFEIVENENTIHFFKSQKINIHFELIKFLH